MIYGEFEFLGIADMPRINTIFGVDSTLWNEWNIILKDDEIEIQTCSKNVHICLEDVMIVDRPLPHAIVNKIQNSSKHSSVMVIDYKKDATIGIGEVVSSMIIAGKKTEISNLKHMLMSLLGFSADPLIGTMEPADIRLLCLLASGINSLDFLIPIFEGNESLVNKTFASLKSKSLVDKYASLTPLGMELVDKVKGVEKKKLGSDIREEFDNLADVWSCLEYTMPASMEENNRVIWKFGNSKMCGNVATTDIKKIVPPQCIKQAEVEIPENTCFMDFIIRNNDDSEIVIKSRDYSVIIALYGCLNEKEDIQMRIMFCYYLGFNQEKDVLDFLQMPVSRYSTLCEQLVHNKLLDLNKTELTNTGLDMVHRKIIGDVSVLFKCTLFEYKSENFKKIEAKKKECAKKKILDILQNKHGKKLN